MIEATVETDRWTQAIAQFPRALQIALEDMAKTFRTRAEGRTPVLTGALKRSWSGIEYHPTGFSFGTDVPYATVLESGGYTGVGPRTVEYEGGIYSRQAPGGILRPLVVGDVLEDVLNLFIRRFQEALDAGT